MKKLSMKKDRRLTQSNLPLLLEEDQKNLKLELLKRGGLVGLNNQLAPLENLILGAAECLYDFFHTNGYLVRRAEWDKQIITPALLNHFGWVYAFYGDDELPVYVGETGRSLRDRLREHKKFAQWWPHWIGVKVLPCSDQSIRKIFESLIGLAGGYQANRMQPTGKDQIFNDVLLSLLMLKNDTNDLPNFPNEMILDTVDMLSKFLSNLE